MTIDDNLIWERVNYLIEQMVLCLDITTLWYPDYYDVTRKKRFSTGWLQLSNNTSIFLFEKYEIVEYQLVIVRYAYILRSIDGKELLRADNREHHNNIITNPHHIHDFRFGQEKIKLFSGQDKTNPDITEFFAFMRSERR